jgi:hypothetical protein
MLVAVEGPHVFLWMGSGIPAVWCGCAWHTSNLLPGMVRD